MKTFFASVYAIHGQIQYGPFMVDLEKCRDYEDVFVYIEDDLEGEYLKLQRVTNPDAVFDKEYRDFDWQFDVDEQPDLFDDCIVSALEYDWSKHGELLDALESWGDPDDTVVEAMKAYVGANCQGQYFQQAYYGQYADGATFAQEYWTELMDDRHLLQYLVIDWEATWQQMYDYVEYDGFYFRNV